MTLYKKNSNRFRKNQCQKLFGKRIQNYFREGINWRKFNAMKFTILFHTGPIKLFLGFCNYSQQINKFAKYFWRNFVQKIMFLENTRTKFEKIICTRQNKTIIIKQCSKKPNFKRFKQNNFRQTMEVPSNG